MIRFCEPLDSATTPTEMRKAIYRHGCSDSMTRNITDLANFEGLSSEDKYTMLAYHALVERQKLLWKALELSSFAPSPRMIIKDPK